LKAQVSILLLSKLKSIGKVLRTSKMVYLQETLVNSWFNVQSGAHNYIDSVTVTDGRREGFNETDIHGYTAVSFMEGEGYPNLCVAYHPSALSSDCCP
jgi:hypothetical protein